MIAFTSQVGGIDETNFSIVSVVTSPNQLVYQ